MEGVLFRPNISGGINFGANNYEGKIYGCLKSRSGLFFNNDHMRYYDKSYRSESVLRCGNKDDMVVLNKGDIAIVDDDKKMNKKIMKKERMMIKKRSKLLKNLSRDITGLLLDPQKLQLQEASEVLLSQLKELRNEQKELKKKMKEDKAKSKKSTCCSSSSSSSSSSESSDSECEREVLDMSRLKRKSSPVTINEEDLQQKLALVIQEKEAPIASPVLENYTLPKIEQDRTNDLLLLLEGKRAKENTFTTTTTTNYNNNVNNNNEKKIEVCMGGKCKKSGSGALLEEFQSVVGADVDVVGCKCMGKCRDGPNVRLVSSTSSAPINGVFNDDLIGGLNDGLGDSSVLTRSKRSLRSSQPLCIGVGLEDVGYIVSKLVGDGL